MFHLFDLTPNQREELAQAYAIGDGPTVGFINGYQLSNVPVPLPGVGFGGGIKVLGEAGQVAGDAAAAARAAAAAAEAAKGGMQFTTTEAIAVSGSKATEMAKSYEAGIQAMYNTSPYKYQTVVNGEVVNAVADGVTSTAGKQTAVEAKFVEDWNASIRNSASDIGDKPWSIAEQQKMVSQAANYESFFEGGVVYHTNSVELAAYYSQIFKDAGITNFKFVVTPATTPVK